MNCPTRSETLPPSRPRDWRPLGLLAPLALLASLPLAGSPPAPAGAPEPPHWVRASPAGSSIATLAQAPSAPTTLYALANTSDLFVSANRGASWSALPAAPAGAFVNDLVVDPQDASTVYATTNGGSASYLLRTRNGGQSWRSIGFGFLIFALVPDAAMPGVVYAASAGGLYSSPDGGGSWKQLAFGGSAVASLAVDPVDDRTLFAAVFGKAADAPIAVWRSGDRGATWQQTPLAIPGGFEASVPHLLFDQTRPGTAYAFVSLTAGSGAAGSIFRTQDAGASWSMLSEAGGIHDLASSADGALYAATDLGVARSNDAGATWQPSFAESSPFVAAPPDVVARVVVDAGEPEVLYAAGSQGVWKSPNGGGQWSNASRGMMDLQVGSLAVAPTAPSTVLAVAGHGIYASSEHGGAWQTLHTDFTGAQPDRLEAFDPRDPRTIYGFGSDGQADHLFKSSDGGHTWLRLSFPYSCGGDSICDVEMTTLALDPAHPGTVFVGGNFFFHFAGSGEFLFRSADGGATWTPLAVPDQLASPILLAIDPTAPSRFYALTCGGLYRSQDAGAAWFPVGHNLPVTALCAGGPLTLALDSRQPRFLYVGTQGQGVYRSTDAGATFHPFGRGLESVKIAALLVDPANSAELFVGAAGQGVWAWNEGLRTWLPANAGLPIRTFNGVLALDPRAPGVLYAGTVDSGVYRLLPP